MFVCIYIFYICIYVGFPSSNFVQNSFNMYRQTGKGVRDDTEENIAKHLPFDGQSKYHNFNNSSGDNLIHLGKITVASICIHMVPLTAHFY